MKTVNYTHRLPLLAGGIVASMLLVTLASCSSSETDNPEAAKTEAADNSKVKTVELTTLAPEVFNNYIDIQGMVDAEESISLSAEMPGTVAKVNAELGQAVTTGQVLAELDSRVIQQGIAELQLGIDLATTMFEKQKRLWEQKVGTEVQYLTAKNQKESLDKKMASLQEQLKSSKIISPISGIVDAVDIKIGQAIAPGMPAIRVVNMSSLKVKGEVAESYISKVRTGSNAVVIFPDIQDTVKTKVSYAAKVISPLNRTFTITIKLNGNKQYHPNQVAEIKLVDYSNAKALVVPVNIVQRAETGDYVFICKGKKAEKVNVKVGRVYNGHAEILAGLQSGDKLISKGYQELNQGEEVKF